VASHGVVRTVGLVSIVAASAVVPEIGLEAVGQLHDAGLLKFED